MGKEELPNSWLDNFNKKQKENLVSTFELLIEWGGSVA